MPLNAIRTVMLPSGESIPALGQGTWGWGEDPDRRRSEIDAVHAGLDLGMNVLDTAEMYADGGAEELLGEALRGRRDEAFLVSKVLPRNAGRAIESCHQSSRRLGTDWLDLYLLHWRGDTPLEETVEAFERLRERGDIRYWGVSNFDVGDMHDLFEVCDPAAVAANQVLYNLSRRGIEYDLLRSCRDWSLPVMAYSPIEQGRMSQHPALREVAERHAASSAQVAIAWLLSGPGLCTIPRASTPEHVQDNYAALELRLSEGDHAVLDRAFPPPVRPQPLDVL